MKKNYLSLSFAFLSLVTASNASSLQDALSNGKVSGALQAYYFARDNETEVDNDILTLGLDISYETAKYNGFGAKVTFQSASSPWVDQDGKDARRSNMWGSGAQLSEAYLSYDISKTSAQVGRMYFGSPVLGGSGSRVNKEAFEGITLKNTDIPDTTLTFAYMDKFQARTDREGNIGDFTKTFRLAAALNSGAWSADLEDGAYTLALKNKSIENLTFTAAYVDAIDIFKTTYLEAIYNFSNYSISTQYYSSKEENQERGQLFGIKGTAGFGPLSFTAAYTTTGDDADVIPGLGNGADLAYTWSEALAYQYAADLDSTKVLAKYKINKAAYVSVAYLEEDGATYKNGYTNLVTGYKFSGDLKGLDLKVAYEIASKDAKDDELRVRLNYKF
ncbi:OprD family outer membrane porin [Campylobacterota bacterium DY0563]